MLDEVRPDNEVRLKPDTTSVVRPGATLMACTTDSRALGNDAAHQLTRAALARLMDHGVSRVFLKIDSTMRGSVAGQLAGALSAWRMKFPEARAVVCPAYPQMGRTVVANRLLVGASPVHETSISRDPVTPVLTSDLAALIPGSTHRSADALAGMLALNSTDRHSTSGLPVDVVTVDASTPNDLLSIAAAIAAAGSSVIPVGSAGLAGALAQTWGGSGAVEKEWRVSNPRILVVVTSLNPVSRAQAAALSTAYSDVEMMVAPSERVGNSSVAERLGAGAAARVKEGGCNVLGLIGGDGARAVLRALGAQAIRIVDAVVEGVPVGAIVGGSADGLTIFTKAGGFGSEDTLVRVVERLKS